MTTKFRFCSRCKHFKPDDAFSSQFSTYCRVCAAAYAKERYARKKAAKQKEQVS